MPVRIVIVLLVRDSKIAPRQPTATETQMNGAAKLPGSENGDVSEAFICQSSSIFLACGSLG